jgi:hypothetical protein
MEQHPRKQSSSHSPPWEPEISHSYRVGETIITPLRVQGEFCKTEIVILFTLLKNNFTIVNRDKVKFSLVLSHAPWDVDTWGSGCITPRILDLGTRWRWVLASCLGCITPKERTQIPNGWESGWTTETVWMLLQGEKSCPDGNRTPVVRT